MTDMSNTPTMIPLDQLQLSELNERRDVPEAEVEAMATSIVTAGLLQNLIGLQTSPENFEIVGGGKRLRALDWLSARNWTLPDGTSCAPIDPVPVKVTSDPDTATAWAGTENTARSPLHPADEVRSYAAMTARNNDVPTIAKAFAVTERHVQRRLKLAGLPKDALDALRANKITLDMASVLTYASSEKACLAALNTALTTNYHPSNIKHDLTQGTIRSDDRRVIYVGIDAYTEAGGTVIEDLFDEGAWLSEPTILNTLFVNQLAKDTEQIRIDGGWSWAIAHPDSYVSWENTNSFDRINPTEVDLPEGDQRELEALDTKGESTELSEDEIQRRDELEERTRHWPESDRATGGIFVMVDRNGELTFGDIAYRKREDASAEESDSEAGPDDTITKVTAKPPYPQNLIEDMAAIKLHSMQVKLADKSELALDLLAFSITPDRRAWHRPLAIDATTPRNEPEKDDGFTLDSRVAHDTKSVGDADPVAAFEEFRALGKAHRNKVLTHHLAQSLTISGDRDPLTHVLAQLLEPEVRKHWHPTASFFKRIADASWLDRVYIELTEADDQDAAAFRLVAKKDKVAALDKLFNDLSHREALGLSRAQNAIIDAWLPKPLRFDTGEG